MERIELDQYTPRPDLVQRIADRLRAGKTVLLPTDTTWVLACDAMDRGAVQRLTRMRERTDRERGVSRESRERPLALMCGDLAEVGRFTTMDQPQFRLVKRLLPGPYTIVLPASREVPKVLREHRREIGVRMPSHVIAEDVLRAVGVPLFATTARRLDGELLASTSDVAGELAAAIDVLVETEPLIPEETTVLDATTEPPTLVRVGRGPVEDHWLQGE